MESYWAYTFKAYTAFSHISTKLINMSTTSTCRKSILLYCYTVCLKLCVLCKLLNSKCQKSFFKKHNATIALNLRASALDLYLKEQYELYVLLLIKNTDGFSVTN